MRGSSSGVVIYKKVGEERKVWEGEEEEEEEEEETREGVVYLFFLAHPGHQLPTIVLNIATLLSVGGPCERISEDILEK